MPVNVVICFQILHSLCIHQASVEMERSTSGRNASGTFHLENEQSKACLSSTIWRLTHTPVTALH